VSPTSPPDGEDPRRLTVPADLSRVAEVRAWVGEVGSSASLSAARVFDLQVSVSEATANGIEHAASAVELVAWVLPDRLIVDITNDGVFQPGLVKSEDTRRRGLGLPLMVSLADQVHVSRLESNRTKVSLTFFTAAREPSENGSESAPHVRRGNPARAGVLGSKSSGRSLLLLLLLLLPLVLLVVLAVALYLSDIDGVHESAGLLTAFNTLFTSAAGLLVAYLAARTYRVGGSSVQLALGSGAIVLALGSLLAGPMISDPNGAITVYNTAILVSSALFLAAGLLALRSRSGMQQLASRWKLAIAYGASVAFLVVWAILASITILPNVLPAFYVAGAGFTDVRKGVVGVGILLFFAASVCFAVIYRKRPSRFALFASASFAAFAVAMGVLVLTEPLTGTPINWLVRAGTWLGGVHLLAGAMSADYGRGWLLDIERDLEETQARYQGLIETNPDAVWIRSEGRFVYANAAAAKLLGYPSVSELIGKHVDEAFHPETRNVQRERVAEVYAGGISPATDEMFLRADGSAVHASVFRTRVEYKGHLGIQVVARDITERKRAEEALRSSEKTFAELIERSPFGTYIVDSGFRIAFMNASSQTGAFRNVRPLIGRPFTEAMHTLWPDDVAEDTISHFRRTLESGEPYYSPGFTNPRHDVEMVESYEWELQRIVLPDGQWGVICYYFDSTELRQAQQALQAEKERARELAEENGRLYSQQLNIAENLQAAFLHIPSELGPVRLGHLYRSASQAARVGGDFYDVFPVKDNKIAVLMGDVSGHGIEAARTATLVKDVVHAFIHQAPQTHDVLRSTNALLIEKQLPGYVTLFLGIIETETGALRYSSAGHPDMLVRRASGEIERLRAGSSPLGIYADAVWKSSTVELNADDLLVLFTDGVLEARHEGQLFGEKRLETLVGSKRIPAELLPQTILDQVLAFSEGVLKDDVAILALRLTTKAGRRIE